MLKWPGRAEADAATRELAKRFAAAHPELVRLGYFGSYARGDFGPGSDLDLVAIVTRSVRPFAERALDFDLHGLPLPAELIVYTDDEWRAACARGGRFIEALQAETVWVLT